MTDLIASPHFQAYCNVISDVITSLASLGACTAAGLHYFAYLRDKAKAIEKDIDAK
jgi:hypothetical protein